MARKNTPGCTCCNSSFLTGKCGCSIPAAITFLGVNRGNGNQAPPNDRGFLYTLPIVLTYQARPSALGATLPFLNTNQTVTTTTMPANSWFSGQFTASGATPFQCILWMQVVTCSLSLRLLTFDTIYNGSSNEWGIDGTGGVTALLKTSTGGAVANNGCSPFSLNNCTVQSFQQFVPGGASPAPAFGGTHGSDDIPTDASGNAGRV